MCIHFKIHHPYSLKSYSIQQIDADHYYFDDEQTRKSTNEFVDKSLLPLNKLLFSLLKKGKLNIKLSITGTTIALFRQHRADALESFKELIGNKDVSILQNVYYNSLSEYVSLSEYKEQVNKHTVLINDVFGKTVTQNLFKGHHTCSKVLLVDYASVKIESDFQDLQKVMEEYRIDKKILSGTNFWNKGYEKRLLKKLYGLEKIAKYVNDMMLLNEWRRLQDVLYYSVDAGSDSYAHIKNILSDFEIVLIKKYLTKIKRKQKDIPVIL